MIAKNEDRLSYEHQGHYVFDTLRELQRHREATVRMCTAITNAVKAFVRRYLGYQIDLPQKERTAIAAQAAKLVKQVEKGEPVDPEHQMVIPFILQSAAAREGFEAQRGEVEKRMVALAKDLPVAKWAEGICGLGIKGVAMLIGEIGDLRDYPGPAAAWKRMGLAPPIEYAMRDESGDIILRNGKPVIAKPKRRRSVAWQVGDSMLKQPKCPYRADYLAQKRAEYERALREGKAVVAGSKATATKWHEDGMDEVVTRAEPGQKSMTCMHIHRRAQRIAEKNMLRDLWCVANGQEPAVGHIRPDAHVKVAHQPA